MTADSRDVISPRDAACGSTSYVPDERLPMLAAAWLADGWNSEALVELASMTEAEARTDARRLLPTVLDSLGVMQPYSVQNEAAARYAALIASAAREMDGRFVPYSVAQKVLEAVDDDPQTFQDMPGAAALRATLRDVEQSPSEHRDAAQAAVRAVLARRGAHPRRRAVSADSPVRSVRLELDKVSRYAATLNELGEGCHGHV